MKINYHIYIEDDFHPIDILGEVELSDGKNKIIDSCMMLDNFFCSLIQGLIAVKRGNNVIIDLINVFDPIEFLISEKSIKINYMNQFIITNIISLEGELKKTIASLLDELKGYDEIDTLFYVKAFRDFLDNNIPSDSVDIQLIIKEWR